MYKSQISTFHVIQNVYDDIWTGSKHCSSDVQVETNAKKCFQMQFDPDLVSDLTSVQTGQSNFLKAYTYSYIRVHQVL